MNNRDEIIRIGLDLWRSGGEPAVSARAIARQIGLTHAGVLYYWRGAEAMRDEIAQHAVRLGDAGVIRRLIVDGHAAVAGMDPATRQGWLAGA